jgi:hypothetical protein
LETAYPFVRLHQPSAFYGVNSRALGTDAIDTVGPNAGFYERATAGELLDDFQRVLGRLDTSWRNRLRPIGPIPPAGRRGGREQPVWGFWSTRETGIMER